MGACFSATDRQGKLQSDLIDRQIEEDQKKFKRECKILLLGNIHSYRARRVDLTILSYFSLHLHLSCISLCVTRHRFRRIRKEHDREADEDYPPGRVLCCRTRRVQTSGVQERARLCACSRCVYAQDWTRMR